MATGPKVLGASFDDTDDGDSVVSFDVPDDEWWLFKEIRFQRSNSTINSRALDIEGYEVGASSELVWRRSFAMDGTSGWDGDSRTMSDDPILVLRPGERIVFTPTNSITTSDWFVAQLLGVSVDPSNHKIISERTIVDDVTSTFTTPSGAHWLFPHLMGQGDVDRSDLTSVNFEINHPSSGLADKIGYSLDDMLGASSEEGYAHQPHCRTFYDGMHLDVEYSSTPLDSERYIWYLIGQEVT